MLTVSHFDSTLLPYLSSSLCTYQPSHSFLSSTERLVKIPKTDLKTFGRSFFSYATPTVWNSLRADLKASPSLQTFKAKINTHLFHQTFWLICTWSLLPAKCLCMSVCVCVRTCVSMNHYTCLYFMGQWVGCECVSGHEFDRVCFLVRAGWCVCVCWGLEGGCFEGWNYG